MIVISKDELRELSQRNGLQCVSMFLPTHRVTNHVEQDRLRLKNLLGKAEDRLTTDGMRRPEALELLKPAQKLLDDNLFWQHQGDGLAIFLAQGFWRRFRAPITFTDLLVVGEHFQLKPLLPLFMGDGRFFVLAISQDRVRLLEGTKFSLEALDLDGVPTSLADALRFDDPERQLQYHTRAPAETGRRDAMFHGHGQAHGEDDKNQLLRYFQQVDRGLQALLKEERIPLLLAAVEYYLPIYREASHYPHLVNEVIAGNPDQLSLAELHKRAWGVVEPQFRREREEARARYHQFAGTGRTSSDLDELVKASAEGRIESLFVVAGKQAWGHFDPKAHKVERHDVKQSGDRDLLDLAAIETFLKDGTVFVLKPGDMPQGAQIAAVYRY